MHRGLGITETVSRVHRSWVWDLINIKFLQKQSQVVSAKYDKMNQSLSKLELYREDFGWGLHHKKKEHSKKILDCVWKMLSLWWISYIYGSCLLNICLCRLISECCYETGAVSQPTSDRQEKRALHDFTSQKLASLELNHGRRDLQAISQTMNFLRVVICVELAQYCESTRVG